MTHDSRNRRPHARVYPFEIVVVVSFACILLLADVRSAMWHTLPFTFILFALGSAVPCAAGVALRLAIATRKGTQRRYLRVITSRGWLLDTLRMVVSIAVGGHVYCWIKLQVPLLHPRLFDPELWAFDRLLFFGRSPNVFFLELFSSPVALHAVDLTYAHVFGWSIPILYAVVLSAPDRRHRVAFATGNALLWLGGAWLYLAIPAVGPVYRYPDVWAPYLADLPRAAAAQVMLFDNYTQFIRPTRNVAALNVLFGVAAFPSLHVGQMMFAFLWLRRYWRRGELLYGIALFLMSISAMVTGWHYLIDVVGGFGLAWGIHAVIAKRIRLTHAERLLHAMARRNVPPALADSHIAG